MYGAPLKVIGFYDSSRARFDKNNRNNMSALEGTDGLLTRLIVEKMNASLQLSEPEDGLEIGELFPNKTSTGCLAALMSGKYDLGLNVRFYRLNQFEGKVEATHAIGRDDICFLVPRKGKAPDFANIFRPFRKYTWISIFISLPCYTIVFYLLVFRHNRLHSLQYFLLQFFAYMLQQSASFIPRTNRQRILIIFWVVSVFLLSSMYQGKMSGSLIIPKDQPDIANIEQLANSDLKVMSFSRYNRQIIEFFSDPKYNGVYKPLFKKLINGTIDEFNDLLTKFDPSYAFANKYHINVHLRRIYTQDSSIYFHHVQQCAVPFLGVYGIRYGTPYKGRINFIIRQAQEGGLLDKWERVNTVSEQKTQAKLHGGNGLVPFSLLHLQTAFYVYVLGCVTAIGAFISEMAFTHFVRKKKTVTCGFFSFRYISNVPVLEWRGA
ncbi:uncharacterized protein LOC129568382 [Sitodiplosis mosellana]|uniref:uncharacterized protein LOC129568382 n=1 Tax=Sitodiplosis mosellana TaxID=263140 RepID=UPI002444EAC3|nr:uncharacterized protein LOC129568382 [Sitodiplosis mosellana]